jgi:hypothetical protein
MLSVFDKFNLVCLVVCEDDKRDHAVKDAVPLSLRNTKLRGKGKKGEKLIISSLPVALEWGFWTGGAVDQGESLCSCCHHILFNTFY